MCGVVKAGSFEAFRTRDWNFEEEGILVHSVQASSYRSRNRV